MSSVARVSCVALSGDVHEGEMSQVCRVCLLVSVSAVVTHFLTEISTRPFQLVTGRVWKGTAFGGEW